MSGINVRFHAILAGGALGLVFLAPNSTSAQDKAFLRVTKISVMTTNPQGKAWDPFGGAPDPIVHIQKDRLLGSKVVVSGIENKFAGVYPKKKQKDFIVTANDRVRIRVYDADVDGDDFIGGITITITAEDIRKGRRRLEKFGRVIYLELELGR